MIASTCVTLSVASVVTCADVTAGAVSESGSAWLHDGAAPVGRVRDAIAKAGGSDSAVARWRRAGALTLPMMWKMGMKGCCERGWHVLGVPDARGGIAAAAKRRRSAALIAMVP